MTGPDDPVRGVSGRPLAVAVLGAGDMGARHAGHWAAVGARVAVVADPDLARASALAARYGAEATADAEAAAAWPGATVASVCTPTFLHAPLTVRALDAGLDVLCEKPVALTLEDAAAMAEAERRSGRTLRIGFMRRFDPVWCRVEADTRRLGGPWMAQATLAAGVRPKLLMHDADANGGPVIDMACHLFDRWRAMFGRDPVRLSAVGHAFGADKPQLAGIRHVAIDTVQVALDYGDAGAAQVQLSWGLPAGVPAAERHAYLAPGGWIEVEGDVRTREGAEPPSVHGDEGVDAWGAQIAAFARELAGGGPQGLATVEDGISALRVSLAVLASVRERRQVDLAAIADADLDALPSGRSVAP